MSDLWTVSVFLFMTQTTTIKTLPGNYRNLFLVLRIQQLNQQLLFYSTGQQEITKKYTKNLN